MNTNNGCDTSKLVDDLTWNETIRNNVDALLAEAGHTADSSVRHQLSLMRFSPQEHLPSALTEVSTLESGQ